MNGERSRAFGGPLKRNCALQLEMSRVVKRIRLVTPIIESDVTKSGDDWLEITSGRRIRGWRNELLGETKTFIPRQSRHDRGLSTLSNWTPEGKQIPRRLFFWRGHAPTFRLSLFLSASGLHFLIFGV